MNKKLTRSVKKSLYDLEEIAEALINLKNRFDELIYEAYDAGVEEGYKQREDEIAKE